MITRLRTLTRKSKVGFGKHSELTVQRMLDLYRHKDLIYYYFNYEKINFTEDVLDELKVTKEYRINKPLKSYSMYKKFNENSYYNKRVKRTNSESDKLMRTKELSSKESLMRFNRGY